MKDTIVLFPSPAMGHLVSMVELGKRFLQLNPPFSITILVSYPPFNTGSTDSYIQNVQSTFPAISFHHLPPISLPLEASPSPHPEALMCRFIVLNIPLVLQSLLSISKSYTIRALVFDFFCYPILDKMPQLNSIPFFCFFPSPASYLALFIHFPTIHDSLDIHDRLLCCPGLPPLSLSTLPLVMLDRDDEIYELCLTCARYLPTSAGILINSFDSLEPRALKALSEGACVPDGQTPPIYCIGPLIAAEKGVGGAECLNWLDSQPSRSVVFLCFGSLGVFSAAQLKEIAVGLERSEQRFLWVVRSPPSDDPTRIFLPPIEPDLDALLPQGFLERTKERGMVVKSWAPQVAVLSKESVGAFVTHCGWNSVLESVWAGVPLVAWPLYAEQKVNQVVLVEELKLAMPMEGAEKENGWVTAEEVEKRVRGILESDEGKALRERTGAMKEAAVAALNEGGSTHSTMTELAELWMRS